MHGQPRPSTRHGGPPLPLRLSVPILSTRIEQTERARCVETSGRGESTSVPSRRAEQRPSQLGECPKRLRDTFCRRSGRGSPPRHRRRTSPTRRRSRVIRCGGMSPKRPSGTARRRRCSRRSSNRLASAELLPGSNCLSHTNRVTPASTVSSSRCSRSRRSPGGTRSARRASIRRSASTSASAQKPLDRRRGRQDGPRAPTGLDEPPDQVLVRLRLRCFFVEPLDELTRRAAREGPESVQAAQLRQMLVPGLGPHRVVAELLPVQMELAADEVHDRRRNELARGQQAAWVAEDACASRRRGSGPSTGSRALRRARRAFRGRRHDLVREPDAGDLHVRFDERRLETEPLARSEAPASAKAAGNSYPLRLPPPRQSSTLLNPALPQL